MSFLETASPQIYSADFTLVAGALAPGATANFDGTSEVLYVVRKAVNLSTAPGVPHASVLAPSAGGAGTSVWKLGVYSSTSVAGADVSTYTVYWVNKTPKSMYLVSGVDSAGAPLATQVAGQYFAP